MEITWYGHSCFRLTERNYATVVTDPYDNKSIGYSALRLKSDIVTVSHDAPGHNNTDAVKGTSHVIDGAGEFEIGGVFITGVQTDGGGSSKRKGKEKQGELVLDEGLGLTTKKQAYDLTSIINEVRSQVDVWRTLAPNQWQVTPETARLLQHWRHHAFGGVRPFF